VGTGVVANGEGSEVDALTIGTEVVANGEESEVDAFTVGTGVAANGQELGAACLSFVSSDPLLINAVTTCGRLGACHRQCLCCACHDCHGFLNWSVRVCEESTMI